MLYSIYVCGVKHLPLFGKCNSQLIIFDYKQQFKREYISLEILLIKSIIFHLIDIN